MKTLALALAFLLEVVAFVSFSCLGVLLPLTHPAYIAIFVALFISLITFWGLFMAPKAIHKFRPPAYYLLKAIIYVLAALVLWLEVSPLLSLAFATCVVIDEAALFKHNLS
jgi:hypothetical protein